MTFRKIRAEEFISSIFIPQSSCHSEADMCSIRFAPPSRSLLRSAVAALALLAAPACDSIISVSPPAAPAMNARAMSGPMPQAPSFVSRVPQYPAPVVYILYREYLHKTPGLTSLSPDDKRYQQHMERRLRQLYPARGYPGMVRDAVEEHREQRLAWAEYQRKVRSWSGQVGIMACDGGNIIDPETGENCFPGGGGGDPALEPDPTVDPSWEGQEEYAPPGDDFIPTLQMEIDSLQMTQPEIDNLYYQESLADGSFFQRWDEVIVTTSTGARATLDDLIVAAGEGWTPLGRKGGREEITIQIDPGLVAAVLVHAYVGYQAWRIHQSVGRARAKALQYFPQAESSTQRDAYRHIFWNMQMRRYAGAFTAKLVADGYEATGNNEPNDRVMDLHNNYIGREVRYRAFRGHLVWDRWDWHEWAEKVRNYMNRPENAEYIPEWRTSPPSLDAAKAREQLVPAHKYIYFR